MKYLISVLLSLTILGCASYSQMFINANGQMQRCGAYGQGLIGMASAQNIQNDCIGDMKKAGYIEIEKAGVIGIKLSQDTLVTILKVMPNSPASGRGIMGGDILLSVNGQKVKSQPDASTLLFGDIGDFVNITVSHNGQVQEYRLIRRPYTDIYGNP